MSIPKPRWFRTPRQSGRTFPCPLCGEPVGQGALGCRSCGSDSETGWSGLAEEMTADLGTPLADFDYDEYLDREFSGGSLVSKHGRRRLVLVLVLLAFIASLVVWGL